MLSAAIVNPALQKAITDMNAPCHTASAPESP